MKTLLIIRHAKSSWNINTLNDFDRPLNDRGFTDAPIMAKRIHEKNILIDSFISSPAKRAITTCNFFAKEYTVKENNIIQIPALYHASVDAFYNVVAEIKKENSVAAIFSHNPGITYFVNELTNIQIDNMPTCGVFAVTFKTDDWAGFKQAKKEFLLFDYPKNK